MKPGDLIAVRSSLCIVRIIRPAGTVDVEAIASGQWYRVSGLQLPAPSVEAIR